MALPPRPRRLLTRGTSSRVAAYLYVEVWKLAVYVYMQPVCVVVVSAAEVTSRAAGVQWTDRSDSWSSGAAIRPKDGTGAPELVFKDTRMLCDYR